MKAISVASLLGLVLLATPALARTHKTKPVRHAPAESLSRTGTGEADYGAAATPAPLAALPVQAIAPPAPSPGDLPPLAEPALVADDGYSERNFTYVPPGAGNQAAGQAGGMGADPARLAQPASPAAELAAETALLEAGQSFHGATMAAPAAAFETGIALDQQGFAELWQRIGQPAPAGHLASGMGAVFASSGPQTYSGHDVQLRTLNEDRDSGPLLVEVTFIQPSPRVAIGRQDTCPWRILIVPASDIKLVARRSYAGFAAK